MPSWLNPVGLAVNLLGAIVVAFAQAYLGRLFEAWLSTTALTAEMHAAGGDVTVFRGWDRQVERARRLTGPLSVGGWSLIIIGVLMQLLAAAR